MALPPPNEQLAMSVADGNDATLGATTDAASASTVVGLLKNLKAALAGILSVKIDQTTPGTTNAVESNHYGTPAAGASVSVGTTSTTVLGANAARKFLALCNDSANVIYLDLSGAAAVASKGVRLNAGGGALVLDRYVPTGAIKAIASDVSSVLTVQEG